MGRQASVLDQPAPSMSRGLSAAHHRRWAAYAMGEGLRVEFLGFLGIKGLGFRILRVWLKGLYEVYWDIQGCVGLYRV